MKKGKTGFTVRDCKQKPYRWYFLREKDGWLLEDGTGYRRWVGFTWSDALARILIVVSNHGLTCELS